MSKQRVVSMEQIRQQSLQAWAQANRQAMHESVRNTPVNQAPVAAAAAGASGVGGGGEGRITGLYEVATDGNIYSYDDGSITLGSFFPEPAVCCDRGDGSFYYVFQWNTTYYFGTFNWTTGQLTPYTHNLDDVAQSGTYPAKSLYLEPGGNLIMADGKGKAVFTNIIRIVPNAVTANAVATVVSTASEFSGGDYLTNLFTYNGDVWGIDAHSTTAGGYYNIGRYDIDRPGFVTGYPVNELLLYTAAGDQVDPGDVIVVSVVQATDSRVYMIAFYQDPVTSGDDFGVFEIVEGQNGLQQANFQRLAYLNNGADIVFSLFNKN